NTRKEADSQSNSSFSEKTKWGTTTHSPKSIVRCEVLLTTIATSMATAASSAMLSIHPTMRQVVRSLSGRSTNRHSPKAATSAAGAATIVQANQFASGSNLNDLLSGFDYVTTVRSWHSPAI